MGCVHVHGLGRLRDNGLCGGGGVLGREASLLAAGQDLTNEL